MLSLLLHRDDLHGDVARDRIELELVQDRPAEHVRQEDIERDRGGPDLPRQGQRVRALVRDDALEAVVAREAEQDSRVMRVVLDDEHDRIALDDRFPVVGDALITRDRQDHPLGMRIGRDAITASRREANEVGAGIMQRQEEREDAALAVHARELDFATEQHGEFATDGEA